MTCMNVNLHQAHNAFVSCIAVANQHHTDPAVLSAVYQEKLDRLDQYMDVLSQLASAGMEEQLAPLLTTLLQEWAQSEHLSLPNYRVLDATGPEHRRDFVVEVEVNGRLARGSGASKRDAQEAAAAELLRVVSA